MQKPTIWFATFLPGKRRVFITLGMITLAFIIFSLITIKDLLAPNGINEIIVNSMPILISVIGCISTVFAWRGRTRLASYILLIAIIIGFLIIALLTTQSIYTSIAELIILIIPIIIAIQSFSEREFIWVVIISILGRSAIQILGIFKTSGQLSGVNAQTAQVAQWISILVTVLFGIYLAFNLNNYPFRTKMILVLGILTIVPTSVITSISKRDLESNLFNQANQNLVFTSDQLASGIDSFIETNLDISRTAAQDPAFINYLGDPGISTSLQGALLPRGTALEKTGMEALTSLLKKDPVNILSCKVLDKYGVVQISTDQTEIHQYDLAKDFFIVPYKSGVPYASPISLNADGGGTISFSSPIRFSSGVTIGVLDITYSASILQQIIIQNSDKLGTDVSAMLLDENNIILAHSSDTDLVNKIVNPPDQNTIFTLIYTNRLQDLPIDQLSVQMAGLATGLEDATKIPYFSGNFHPQQLQKSDVNLTADQAGVAKLSSRNWNIVTFVPQKTLLAPVQSQTQNIVLLSILISLISIATALALTQVLISPILKLTHTSELISQGDMEATAMVNTQDEIGVLAKSFNSMTGRIRDLIGNLEQRVTERTQALEHRAIQLQAAADVSSTAARLRDLNVLLRQVTRLISQRFGYYHVGVFLLDERGEYAVLRASNSEGGQRMLARGHALKVGRVGIVGYVTGTGQPRIALNVGKDAEFFNNPDLPMTQSEMALPLMVGSTVLGALDIQSLQEGAFTPEDITTLKVLADQIAIAIENARLFSENQAALESAQRAYGNISLEAWKRLLSERLKAFGYISTSEGQTFPVAEEASPAFQQAIQSGQYVMENNDTVLLFPVKIRGKSIGAIRMEKQAGGGTWKPEDIDLANSLSFQLGAALESARLYQDINLRAQQDSAIAEISGRIGETLRMESILKTTAEELSKVFVDASILVQLKHTD